MSGRLTILPKKSYCPWNQENVERVLRDERLERERVEKEARADEDSRRQRRRLSRGDDDDGGTKNATAAATADNGHINLFPEAKEAEPRVARGQGPKASGAPGTNSNNDDGIPSIPLGGDEAAKRKMGTVPFYMRSNTTKADETSASGSGLGSGSGSGGGGKYDSTSALYGLRGKRSNDATAAVDEITSRIMRDQYEKREDSRKFKMDPMSRFFVGANVVSSQSNAIHFSTRIGVVADNNNGGASSSGTKQPTDRDGNNLDMTMQKKKKDDDELHRKKHRGKRSRRRLHDESDCSSVDSDCSSSCSSPSQCSSAHVSSTHSNDGNRKRRHSRSRKSAERRRSGGSRSDERQRYNKSRRKHRSRDRRESKRRRGSSRRHRSPSSDSNDRNSSKHSQQRKADNELEELRKRRRAREAREKEREKKVLAPDGGTFAGNDSMYGNGGYQNQFNPTLSRI